jgi:hypothetical protein
MKKIAADRNYRTMKKIAADRNYKLTKRAAPATAQQGAAQQGAAQKGIQIPVERSYVYQYLENLKTDTDRLTGILNGSTQDQTIQNLISLGNAAPAVERAVNVLERRVAAIRSVISKLIV